MPQVSILKLYETFLLCWDFLLSRRESAVFNWWCDHFYICMPWVSGSKLLTNPQYLKLYIISCSWILKTGLFHWRQNYILSVSQYLDRVQGSKFLYIFLQITKNFTSRDVRYNGVLDYSQWRGKKSCDTWGTNEIIKFLFF